MAYFSKEFVAFLRGLAKNNNRAWFNDNRETYEQAVKHPFRLLVEDLLLRLRELDPDIDMQPKDAIFRINRDIRFSKDKTPYITMVKAGFARGGRKSPYAGYYLGIDADKLHVGGGVMAPDKDALNKIREHIAAHTDSFVQLTTDKTFVKTFGEIQGERVKRIPAAFRATVAQTPYIANKQFYYMTALAAEPAIFRDSLADTICKHFRAVTPLNTFLKNAL